MEARDPNLSDVGATWRAFWEGKRYWLKLGFLVAIPGALEGVLWDSYFNREDVVATPAFLGAHFVAGLVTAFVNFVMFAGVCRACMRRWRNEATRGDLFSNLPLRNLAILGLLLAAYGTCERLTTLTLAQTGMKPFAEIPMGLMQLASWVPLLIVLPLVVDGNRGPCSAIAESIRAMFQGIRMSIVVTFLFGLTLLLATMPLLVAGAVVSLWGEANSAFDPIAGSVTMWAIFAVAVPLYYLFVTRVYLLKRSATPTCENP